MSDSFFVTRKRKKPSSFSKSTSAKLSSSVKSTKRRKSDGEDSASEDDMERGNIEDMDLEGSDLEKYEEDDEALRIETPTEKRRRLANQYIENLRKTVGDGEFDAEEIDRDIIAERLQKDTLEATGRLYKRVADTFTFPVDISKIRSCRGHELSVTSVALKDTGDIMYTGSKDGSIIKWSIPNLQKLHTFPGGRKETKQFDGHVDHVLCLAISSDGKYLASGGKDAKINVWSVKENKLLKCFRQHKDAVSGLAFRRGANQLYSASYDRTVKVWNIDELSYIETLFGHQDSIISIDTLAKERCVTTGGRDRSIRLWKIIEESQLVFRGGSSAKEMDGSGRVRFVEGSLDVVAMIDEENFISGGDSGALSLWNISKKKPLFILQLAHGLQDLPPDVEPNTMRMPYWITALSTLKYSDIFASGSWDGFIRLWKLHPKLKDFIALTQVSILGVVNSLTIQIVDEGKGYIAVGVGQELKGGRWIRKKDCKNGSKLIELEVKPKDGEIEQY